MRRDLRERLLFLRAFVTHPRRVGAVLPTSRHAVRDMLDLADVAAADLIVELGAGTGVYTREILSRCAPDSRVVALERDPALVDLLSNQLTDPRLQLICGSAEDLGTHLAGAKAGIVVSGLPFTSLPAGVRGRIFDEMLAALAPGGTVLVLQYSPFVERELRKRFSSVTRRISPLNVPPAFLYACRERVTGGSGQSR